MSTSETQTNQEQIRYWNEESGLRWVQHQQQLDAQIEPLGLAAMQRAGIKLGEQVLDIGCGCGQTSLELAARVGPQGSVVGLDISQPMLARAQERQKELKLLNLTFIRADAQTHAFERERFDLIYSRFGVMFFGDPAAAFRNLRTALRAEGRLCFICWQGLAKNDWARIPLMAATQYVPPPPPPAPHAPGPFAFADPDRLRQVLTAGGFTEISLEPYEAALNMGGARTIEEATAFSLEIGPVATLLRPVEAETRTRVAYAIREALLPYAGPDGVQMNGAAWIVFARPA
jgi:SAM-dependent methyltransferase